jgi:hypothetical protein
VKFLNLVKIPQKYPLKKRSQPHAQKEPEITPGKEPLTVRSLKFDRHLNEAYSLEKK